MKQTQQEVHISIEVWYKSDEGKRILSPGQALFVPFEPQDFYWEVKIKSFVSLWEGEKVYTDMSATPLHPDYLKKEKMNTIANCHSVKDGFGVTTYDVTNSRIPGRFAKNDRWVMEYPIDLLLKHEEGANYIAGPSCSMHLIPEVYAKVSEYGTPLKGDIELYDVLDEKVGKFRRVYMPIVLGAFDIPGKKRSDWQQKLWEDNTDPMLLGKMALWSCLNVYTDPVSGHSGHYRNFWGNFKPDPKSPYDMCGWYLAYPIASKPNPVVLSKPKEPGTIFISPLAKHDALAYVDVGRKRVSNWEARLMELGEDED